MWDENTSICMLLTPNNCHVIYPILYGAWFQAVNSDQRPELATISIEKLNNWSGSVIIYSPFIQSHGAWLVITAANRLCGESGSLVDCIMQRMTCSIDCDSPSVSLYTKLSCCQRDTPTEWCKRLTVEEHVKIKPHYVLQYTIIVLHVPCSDIILHAWLLVAVSCRLICKIVNITVHQRILNKEYNMQRLQVWCGCSVYTDTLLRIRACDHQSAF